MNARRSSLSPLPPFAPSLVRSSRARLSSFAGACALAVTTSLTQGCILVWPWGDDSNEDNDGDGYASWIDCDDFDATVGDECNDTGDGDGDGGGDPAASDSDSDGLTDADEASLGTDPSRVDSDGDGWVDGAEVDCGADPLDVASSCAPADSDGDGRSDDEERARGTDPANPDTDGDGYSDGQEATCDSSPLDPQLVCTEVTEPEC